MRIAALYDVHGNLPALEAVLEQVREADVDQMVIASRWTGWATSCFATRHRETRTRCWMCSRALRCE
jgi:hypothetical protein